MHMGYRYEINLRVEQIVFLRANRAPFSQTHQPAYHENQHSSSPIMTPLSNSPSPNPSRQNQHRRKRTIRRPRSSHACVNALVISIL